MFIYSLIEELITIKIKANIELTVILSQNLVVDSKEMRLLFDNWFLIIPLISYCQNKSISSHNYRSFSCCGHKNNYRKTLTKTLSTQHNSIAQVPLLHYALAHILQQLHSKLTWITKLYKYVNKHNINFKNNLLFLLNKWWMN